MIFESVRSRRVGGDTWPSIEEATDLAVVLFTSGSTGRPRGVMLTHRNLLANSASIIEYLGLGPEDRAMLVLPYYCSFGASVVLTHLRVGGSLVIDHRFIFPDKVLVRMQETRCTPDVVDRRTDRSCSSTHPCRHPAASVFHPACGVTGAPCGSRGGEEADRVMPWV